MARPADPHARAALVTAARAEFQKKGLKGARIEDITAACGLSKGAFYLHATSKEALFGEVVAAFMASLQQLIEERRGETECYFREHGPVEARDVAERSERYERLVSLSTEGDLRTLELMWSYRDVVHVLMRGSQGTEFESLLWSFVEREVARVSQEFQRLQSGRALRADVPSTIIGSLIVGTYVLLAQQMCQMQEKPDLLAWAELHPPAHPRGLSASGPRPRGPSRAAPRFPAPAFRPRPLPHHPEVRTVKLFRTPLVAGLTALGLSALVLSVSGCNADAAAPATAAARPPPMRKP